MEKNYKKPLSSPVSVKAVWWKSPVYGGKNLRKKYLLSLEWKRVGVMDNDSGDDGTDELRELGWEKWEKEWAGLGWRNEAGSLFRGKEMDA